MLISDRLTNQQLTSTLEAQSALKPKNGGIKKKLVIGLILTSLVDAFSILVVYLLMTTTDGVENVELAEGVTLPKAELTSLFESGPTLVVRDNAYYIDEQEVSRDDLAQRLVDLRHSLLVELADKLGVDLAEYQEQLSKEIPQHLIVQADRSLSFSVIDPILTASSLSGFHKIRFAVLQSEEVAALGRGAEL